MIYNAKELILLDTNNNTVVAAAKSIEINVKCDTVERTSANSALFREYNCLILSFYIKPQPYLYILLIINQFYHI